MIILREYQEQAIKEIINYVESLLVREGDRTLVLKAPTGSGKTLIMAETLKQIVENIKGGAFSFVWTAPRQLHIQSKGKLEAYYHDNKALKCVFFEDLTDKRIAENEILFLNWESINKEDNIYIRENEKDFNLSNILENTRQAGRTLILIIDESHYSARTEIALGLIHMFQPKITIEVSATPSIQGDRLVVVEREDVIRDEMIKKQISINPEFKNIVTKQTSAESSATSEASETTNEFIIRTALDRRNRIAELFKKSGVNVNPLMLIQLPDRREGTEDLKTEIVSILRNNHSITVENGKLAIYLSEEKQRLETITRNDDDVDVMIFKQAIALGWDCPRAYILVIFREMRSYVFTIQTVGRILRMSELKYYDEDELNTGYIYTNLSDLAIHGEEALGYITIRTARRKDKDFYQALQLKSVHSKRFREETRLSPEFISGFLQAAKELDLKNSISIDIQQISRRLISDGVITNPDIEFQHLLQEEVDTSTYHKGDFVDRIQADIEVQHIFDSFVMQNLEPTYPESRSVGRVKESIYRFFQSEFPMQFEYGGIKSQMIVLDSGNQNYFTNVINRAKEIYMSKVGKDKVELVTDEVWEVPPYVFYSNNFTIKDSKLSILEPFYQRNDASQVEKDFMDFIDGKPKDIEWWSKNGERDTKFFAVPYIDNGQELPFYVDWIAKYKDGRIGLFDTKEGIYADTAKNKAEGLAKYIKDENDKGKKLFGGIVIPKDGSWRYNDKLEYKYDPNNLSEWKFLS